MGQVIVALDGSTTSRRAFDIAIQEAGWRGTSVVAMHVVHYPIATGDGFAYVSIEELRAGGQDFLAEEIEVLREQHGGDFGVEVVPHMAVGHVGVQLVKLAEEAEGGPADLVVMGTRGLGGFRGLLLGSATTYVLHHLTCPLLVVPEVPAADKA